MRTRNALLLACGTIACLALAKPAFATPAIGDGITAIGAHPLYGTSYSALWRTFPAGFNDDYGVLLGDLNTYFNVNSAASGVFFWRAENGRRLLGRTVPDPDGGQARMYLDNNANLVVGGAIEGGMAAPYPSIGVYGQSDSGYGLEGFAISGALAGVLGQSNGSGAGVLGTCGSGYGVKGVSTNNYGVIGTSTNSAGVFGSTTFVGNQNAGVIGSAPSGGLAFYGVGGITITGNTATKASGTTWVNPSDARIKKDVASYVTGLEALEHVRPVTFKFNGQGGTADDGKTHVGVIAQELQSVAPSMVIDTGNKLADGSSIKAVDASDFTFMLINSVKELAAQNRDLAAQVKSLQSQVSTLKKH